MKRLTELVAVGCFCLGLGATMGYQLHEQTTPAAEVAQQTAANTNKIAELCAWRDKYAKPIVIKATRRNDR